MANLLQEDRGLVKIHQVCIDMDGIWRPTNTHDLGIDGQIEFLEPGTSISTGQIVAVQSKSGPSYFKQQDDAYVKFYPEDKHRDYWRKLKLPVVLVLHNPDENITIYANVKAQLLKESGPILVSKNKVFDANCRTALIMEAETEYYEPSAPEILDKFSRIELDRGDGKILNGIDFLLACTSSSRTYFQLRMKRICALFSLVSEDSGYVISGDEYEFILRNVLALHTNKLVEDFLEEFEYYWYDLHSVPDLESSFTFLGDYVLEHLWGNIATYLNDFPYAHLGIDSPYRLARHITNYAQQVSDKLDASDLMAIEPR